MSEAVRLEVEGGVATITIDRAENRNAMSVEVLDGFAAKVREVRAMRPADARCVIVTGAGKFFCSGADFRATAELGARSGLDGPVGARESVRGIYEAFLSVLEIEVPVIAAINGHAIGGGLGLALLCDLRVANEEAKLGANFVRLGLHPGMGVTELLPRILGVERAAELLFTGRIVTGKEAAAIGLAGRAVSAPEVMGAARALALEIAAAAPLAVRMTKRTLRGALGWDPRRTVEVEAFAQALSMQTDDAREGVAALLGKREPVFRGR